MKELKGTAVWENNGEPVDGKVRATIDFADGSGVQVFEGATHKEVADKLMVAQLNASALIKEQREVIDGKTPAAAPAPEPPLEFKPRPLTAGERMQVANDITDPTKAAEAVKTVVEAAVGAPLAQVAEQLQGDQDEKKRQRLRQMGKDFCDETPDYLPCAENEKRMYRYMQANGIAYSKEGLKKAFGELTEIGLLIVRPANAVIEGEPTAAAPSQPAPAQGQGGLPAQPAATVRPRPADISTGLRSGDSSGAPSGTVKPRLTAREVEMMPKAEYDNRLRNEPGFAKQVDEAYAVKAPAR